MRLGDALDGVLVVEPVADQVGDRAEFEAVLAAPSYRPR
jgi:hypothetical protein